MLKKSSLLWIIALLLVSFSCTQLKQMANFTKCQFRMSSVQNTNLAGVNVQQIKSLSDMNLLQAGKLTAAYASGTMPLSLTINVDAQNPNDATAAMNKMEWILLIEGKEIVTGTLNDRVSIAPSGGTATIPVQINADLRKIMAKNSMDENINLGLGLVGAGNKPSPKLSLKIKPSIMIGSLTIPYPGYITLSTNFGTGS
ncbi:hypothetical protein [Xanthocytophaga agilis]|uniref:Late embryogenesis abundant protein LEA-2 subgroup domain-containing protein n=1 Tax=Xanthocytophaga agilis TaxID=3048010 RepID=A0AAE3R0G3_9BACT|nr:hypothetical protein [Xanthocytophaga agilis]MDJ1499135.1 hypothetical protein [Xanthocytophaga agilis]